MYRISKQSSGSKLPLKANLDDITHMEENYQIFWIESVKGSVKRGS
jgi:hypothetical protein